MRIFSLGDSAITIDLGNIISEELNNKVLAMQQWFQLHPFDGMKELIAGYSTLTIYYEPYPIMKKYHPPSTAFAWVREKMEEAFEKSSSYPELTRAFHQIPVCYDEDFGFDLANMATVKNVSTEKIIEWHTAKSFRVYMIGFLPGFPYLGVVDKQLAIPRKQKPLSVEAGSVGIAGTQTGIYPFKSPGGWHIIGRTPVSLFNHKNEPPVWLKPGDEVKFFAIDRAEWERIVKDSEFLQ